MFNILREWLLTQRNALPCIRVIITMRSGLFPANSALDCVRFAKFRPQFSEPCGATYRRSRPYTIAVEFFFQILQLSIPSAWCAHTFPPIFGLTAIFDSNFTKIVAPPSNECAN